MAEVEVIQAGSPEAAQWAATEYLQYDFRVAERNGRLAGFLVSRRLAPDEAELLTIAVAPEFRRQGVAGALFAALAEEARGQIFLEVRESNEGARKFYKSLGFQEVNTRREYYENPLEAAIVMKFHSC